MQNNESEKLKRWLSAALEGSPYALGELLEALRDPLEDFATRQLGSSLRTKASASDLVQESLAAAAASFSQFRGKNLGELRVWIAQILEHRAIDLARKFRGPMRDVSREDRNGHSIVSEVEDSAVPILEQAVYAETFKRLREVLEGLDEDDRNLIHWRYQDGQSFEEIGKKLGWPRETTRRRWYELVERVGLQLGEAHYGRTSPAS